MFDFKFSFNLCLTPNNSNPDLKPNIRLTLNYAGFKFEPGFYFIGVNMIGYKFILALT